MFNYHYKLQIIVMYDTPILKEVISNVLQTDELEPVLSCCGREEELPEKGDIVFFGINDAKPLLIRQKYGSKARLILCAKQDEAETLPKEELCEVNEIWDTPLKAQVTQLRFNRLMEDIGREKKNWMLQNCLDTTIETIPDMLWFKSVDGIHTKVNQSFCNIVGKAREDVVGRDHCYIWNVSPDDISGAGACQESEDHVIKEKRTCQFFETVKYNNDMRYFKTYKSPVFDENGVILGTIGMGHDITDLKNLGMELQFVLSSMPYGILIKDLNGNIINVNPVFEEYFGVSRDEILGASYSEWAEKTFEPDEALNKEGYLKTKSKASELILEMHEDPIRDMFDKAVGKINTYRDVTKVRRLEAQILHSANTDFLTGLNNRRSFYKFIRDHRGKKQLSLLSIDLDHFKSLNDLYGHQVGDDVLVWVSNLFRRHFENDFITRFGGDEFVIAVLGPCTVEELLERSKKLQADMAESFKNDERIKFLTLSVGIAQTNDLEMSIDDLINQGDTALYEAKRHGKNRCCVYSDEQIKLS